MVQLAGQRLQLVAPVAVEQHQLLDVLPLQRIDQVGEHAQQCGRRDAERKGAGNLQVVRVDAERDRRQQQHLCAGLVRAFARPAADFLDLVVIRSVRHVQVVRLGGAEREDGHVGTVIADECVILLGQDPGSHARRLHERCQAAG